MNEMIQKLIDYNHQINIQLIQDMEDLADLVPEKSRSLFSHILNSHHVWLSRIVGETPKYSIWEQHVMNSFKSIEISNFERTIKVLSEEDLHKEINYSNSSGQNFKNSIEDIILHIVNHSTYHRGQIALLHRQNEITPLPTDYIMYRRNIAPKL